jgi:hypothetical protein
MVEGERGTGISGGLPILYLDIDGVCLKRRHRSVGMFDAFEIAPGCLDFLIWATAKFRVRWLSMRTSFGRRSDPQIRCLALVTRRKQPQRPRRG